VPIAFARNYAALNDTHKQGAHAEQAFHELPLRAARARYRPVPMDCGNW
jgi:hypothetical protein